MYIVPKHNDAYFLCVRGKVIQEFVSYEDMISRIGFRYGYSGSPLVSKEEADRLNANIFSYVYAPYITSPVGVNMRQIKQDMTTYRNSKVVDAQRYTGAKRRGRYGTYLKKPQTYQEARINQHVDDDDPKARPARCYRNLPSYWDEVPKSTMRIRSWKRYRKTQWK